MARLRPDSEWRSLIEGPVRPVGVVVVDVVIDELFELSLVPDNCAVEQFASQRSDPAFGERVGDWRSDWGLENLEAFGSEDLVEAVDELAAAVTYEGSMSGPDASATELRCHMGRVV